MPDTFSREDRAYLLALARSAAAEALGGPKLERTPPASPALLEKAGCFTTFKRKDVDHPGRQLRGCLGCMEAQEPLWEAVIRMAAGTVTEDPRFAHDPVTLAELPMLKVDISVLHPPRELADALAFELGVDGIEVIGVGEWEGCRGIFLPQVATEFGMTKEQFISWCCEEKAGMPAEVWRDPTKCKVLAFRAEVFGE